MRAGRIFRHLREGSIRFPPTYKFNKWDPDPLGYDTSEKRRVPAWTDRVFFRGSFRRDTADVRLSWSKSPIYLASACPTRRDAHKLRP